MKRKVGISLFNLQTMYGDRRALEIAHEIGADAVDFNLCDAYDYRRAGNLYAKSEDEIRAYFSDLRRYAASMGLEIYQTHGRGTGFKNIPDEDNALVENARLDCIATAALGARYCVLHTCTTIVLDLSVGSALMHQLHDDMFLRILPYAVENDVVIATETFGDATGKGCCDFFGNMSEFFPAYERIAAHKEFADHFCVCMDVGHTNKATRFHNNPHPEDAIRLLGSRIRVLHLHDNDTMTDQHKIPMTGCINWNAVMDALDEIGYDGVYNLEVVLTHFGKDFAIEEARFAVLVMRQILKTRYSA